MSNTSVFLSGNTAWGMYNFRRQVLEAFIAKGLTVYVAAPYDAEYTPMLEKIGCHCFDIHLEAQKINPLHEWRTYRQYRRLLRATKPNLCFFYTIKPNLYGSLAAKRLGIPHIAITTGLGHAFFYTGFKSWLVKMAYKHTLNKARQVWFLNENDKKFFSDNKLIRDTQAYVLKGGEGVDLQRFSRQPLPEKTTFLLMARLLWDKGVGIFVDAARIVKRRHPEVQFQLLGFVGVDNPHAITQQQIDDWQAEGIVDYLGSTNDVRPYIANSSCVVLPSYYAEGVPFSLIEGAAMYRPLITTDHIGCRDMVDNNQNGYLCKVRDVESVAEAMEKIIACDHSTLQKMGEAGRRKVEQMCDVKLVINQYLQLLGLAETKATAAPLNASIVLYKNRLQQVTNIVNILKSSPVVNQIFIIDNSPVQDAAIAKLPVTYIFNGQNMGYGRAHNIALRKSLEQNCAYHLVLNADINFSPEILDKIVHFMQHHPDVGGLMPKVYYPDGEIQYLCKLLPTPIDLFDRRFLHKKWTRPRIERFELRQSGYNSLMNVPYISGCFMLLRISALRQVGIFDERYFMYCEDIDLSRRLHELYQTVFYPEVSIVHEHAHASYNSLKMLRIHIVNACRYFNKWGWFYDNKRTDTNSKTLDSLNL